MGREYQKGVNNAMNADSQKLLSCVAPRLAAGYDEH